MVRHTDRQAYLNQAATSVLEALQALDRDDDAIDVITNSSDSLDKDEEVTEALFEYYEQLDGTRYLHTRQAAPRRSEKMVDILAYWATRNNRRFRGLARMAPPAFYALVERLRTTPPFRARDSRWTAERAAVALYLLGRSGNGSGVRDIALNCGCSEGSVINWTRMVIEALNHLRNEILTFASEEERRASADWVFEKSGCEQWAKGWAVVDGTHIKLAWRPALYPREYFNYRSQYSLNIALVFLPHSLRIIEAVVGYPGSAQDSHVWVGGSKILAKPRLHLDEGEFIWTDGGYGYSPFTVGPYTNRAAGTSRDFCRFNYQQSRIRVWAEHGNAYLKQRFQALLGYRGNIYREQDRDMSSLMVMGCIIAHTFALRFDQPADVGEILLDGGVPTDDVDEIIQDLERHQPDTAAHHHQRQAAQAEYEQQQALDRDMLGANRMDRLRKESAVELRESLHQALFAAMDWAFLDTDAELRRRERTIEQLVRDENHRRQRNRERSAIRRSQSLASVH